MKNKLKQIYKGQNILFPSDSDLVISIPGEDSKSIGGIIDVITGVVEQTRQLGSRQYGTGQNGAPAGYTYGIFIRG